MMRNASMRYPFSSGDGVGHRPVLIRPIYDAPRRVPPAQGARIARPHPSLRATPMLGAPRDRVDRPSGLSAVPEDIDVAIGEAVICDVPSLRLNDVRLHKHHETVCLKLLELDC